VRPSVAERDKIRDAKQSATPRVSVARVKGRVASHAQSRKSTYLTASTQLAHPRSMYPHSKEPGCADGTTDPPTMSLWHKWHSYRLFRHVC